MNSNFSSQTLVEKLSKLNNSQQSIESLSHWCILHRKKAKQIVETWEKLFNSSAKEQKVSFLYLANDILQNSRRKGSEFVNEFWKVLPGALKSVIENGDDHGKTVVMRLVGIWDERKVFGSRVQGLKDDILGKTPLPLDSNGKSLNPIKVVRKDAQSVRIKLAVGGMPEKIVTAYQSVLDEHFNEDAALNKCHAAVSHAEKIEKDVDAACTQGIQQGSSLMHEIQEQETTLKQCIEQLQIFEATRAALISQLKEALQEQEAKLELIHTQLKVAQAETEHATSMRQRLLSMTGSIGHDHSSNQTISCVQAEVEFVTEPNHPHQTSSTPPPQPSQSMTSFVNSFSAPLPQRLKSVTSVANSASSPPLQPLQQVVSTANSLSNTPPQPLQPVSSFTNSFNSPPPQSSQPVTSSENSLSAEELHRKAAAFAEKLTASTSSVQVLSSVLSSLVAEQAASMNGGLSSGVFTSNPPIFPAEKRPKLEKPMSASDMSNTYFGQIQPQQLASLPLPQASATSIHSLPQSNQPPPPFPPPPPPLPPVPPPQIQQFVQSSGLMIGGVPYSFAGNAVPPPPLTSHPSMGLARQCAPQPPPPPPPPLPPVPPPQQQQQQQQQNSGTTGFFQTPGISFFGQLQTAPPVPAARGSITSQGSSA